MPESDFKLNDADSRVLRGVRDMPLVSTGELADVLGVVFLHGVAAAGSAREAGLGGFRPDGGHVPGGATVQADSGRR